MSSYPKCPRCESNLIGGNTHDAEAECIEAMARHRRITEAALKKIKDQHYSAVERAEKWKLKAKAAELVSPSPGAITTQRRITYLETRNLRLEEWSTKQDGRLERAEQRINFLMTQVEALQGRGELRRRAS